MPRRGSADMSGGEQSGFSWAVDTLDGSRTRFADIVNGSHRLQMCLQTREKARKCDCESRRGEQRVEEMIPVFLPAVMEQGPGKPPNPRCDVFLRGLSDAF